MKIVEFSLTAALCVVDWLHQATKRIGFVLEAWRTKVRQRRELSKLERNNR
jgi:hypothetical protein